MNSYKKTYRLLTAVFGLLLVVSCTTTKLSRTWSDPELPSAYSNIMVMGVTDSEQLRRAYESYFTDHLRDRGMQSLASYTLIDHKSEMQLSEVDKNNFRNIVEKAVEGSDVDAVIITHLVSIEEEDIYRPSPDYIAVSGPAYGPTYYTTAYYDNMYGYHGYVTTYVEQPGYFTHENTYILETNLYDVKTEDLVWTTRSRSFSPESMEDAIQELTGLIIDDLVSRDIIN